MSSNYEVDQQWVEDNIDIVAKIFNRLNRVESSGNKSNHKRKMKQDMDRVIYRGYYELARQELKRKAQEEIIKEEGGSIDLIADLEHVRRLHDQDKWLLHKRNQSYRKLRKKYKDLEKERDNYKQIVEKTKSMLKKPIPTFTPKSPVVQATVVEEKKTLKQRFRNSIMYLK